jgi:hypothetical protein|tara:strand:+ start:187 stop:384 length:198 start_codon:yes stop_codon:yes gene_type:complete
MYTKASIKHLEEVKMTRWQHFKHAVSIAYRMEMAACAVFIHAFFPRWFTKYATNTCKKIVAENKI